MPSRNAHLGRAGAKFIALSCMALWLSACATSARWQLAEGQNAHAFQATVHKHVNMQFLLYLPPHYAGSKERWPLIIFLHGSGERGKDIERVKVNGPPKLVQTQADFPFVVVSPQVRAGMAWDSDALNALLDQLLAQLKIDPDRVYLTGLSMGGYGTWRLASEHPERFAAIAPVSGAGEADIDCKLKHLPIWAFHGAQDPTVPVQDDQEVVDSVRECGGQVEFTVYADLAHDAWTRTYENPELYRWFLRHRRGEARTP